MRAAYWISTFQILIALLVIVISVAPSTFQSVSNFILSCVFLFINGFHFVNLCYFSFRISDSYSVQFRDVLIFKNGNCSDCENSLEGKPVQ